MNIVNAMYSHFLSRIGKFNRHNFQFMALVLLVFSCADLPTDPNNVSNSDIVLSLRSSSGLIHGQLVNDTVGNNVEIIVALSYPQFIKTTKLQVVAQNGSSEYDTTLVSTSKNYRDTIRFTKNLSVAGNKTVIATAFIEDATTRADTAYL